MVLKKVKLENAVTGTCRYLAPPKKLNWTDTKN